MKKYLMPIMTALALSGCGADTSAPPPQTTTLSSTETVTETENTASSVSETSEISVTANNSEIFSEALTAEETDYFGRISGYWYIDGDTSLASLHITADGSFTAFYAYGAAECTGYITCEISDNNEYSYQLYTSDGEPYLTFNDSGNDTVTDIYVINGIQPHFIRVYDDEQLPNITSEQ